MSTPVVMPQMGESIAEGTIVRWIKKVGDSVDRDEPLFEISTDKVDAEIPSPAAGTLLDIAVKEGETVAVNSVVATIGARGRSCEAGTQGVRRRRDRRLRPRRVRWLRHRPTGRPSKLQAAPEPAAAPAPAPAAAPPPEPEPEGEDGRATAPRRSCAGSRRSTASISAASPAPASRDASRSRTFSATSSADPPLARPLHLRQRLRHRRLYLRLLRPLRLLQRLRFRRRLRRPTSSP